MQETGYSSMINAIVDLRTRGFSFDFNLAGNKLLCAQQKVFLRIPLPEIIQKKMQKF